MSRPKKYQIHANVWIAADGFVIAKNKKEAEKKWIDFCFSETLGLSVCDVDIIDVIPTTNRHYDHEGQPKDEEFEYKECITNNYLN